ncbi:MAG TPA: glycoside hydrolase family 20 zincin-like fold domain-containing protein [Rubricoccaceae bacterium]|nr:glycoside hydrolase family 20 zincin-like fold domain-containing protein [Rubricoccaceae bacterium]
MRRPLASALLFTVLVTLAAPAVSAQRTDLSPQPKEVRLSGAAVALGGARVVVDPGISTAGFSVALDAVEDALREAGRGGAGRTVRLRRASYDRPQEYRIEIDAEGAVLSGGPEALVHALSTFEELVDETDGRVPAGTIRDWPDHRLRVLHFFPLTTRGTVATVAETREVLARARRAHFNAVILQVSEVRWDANLARGWRAGAWSKGDLAQIVAYARGSGLEVIPQLSFLTHAEGGRPEWQHSASMYDPALLDDARSGMAAYIEEVVREAAAATGARRFHIAMDEPSRDNPLPPEAILRHIRWMSDLTERLGLEMWMWADLLLDPEDFRGPGVAVEDMNGGISVNGRRYANLLDHIPTRVVLNDWHYWGGHRYPSLDRLARRHRVLGATWFNVYGSPGQPTGPSRHVVDRIGSFSAYAHRLRSPRVLGMIATTWADNFPRYIAGEPWLRDHTFRRYADYGAEGPDRFYASTILVSGEKFWNAHAE